LHIPAVLRSCVARFLRRAGTDANCWPQTPRRHFRSRLVCRQSINARLFCSLFSRLIVEMCEPFGKRPFKSSGFLDTSTLAKIRVRDERGIFREGSRVGVPHDREISGELVCNSVPRVKADSYRDRGPRTKSSVHSED